MAEESFERAAGLNPGSAEVLSTFALLRLAQGRADDAVRLMERAVELDPLSLMERVHMARAYYVAGRLDEAISTAQAVLEMEPAFRAARDGLGWAYLASGQAAKAVECFEHLPRETGDPFNAAAPRAMAYAAAGRMEDAREMLKLLERRAEEQPDMHLHMDFGLAHLALGDPDGAVGYLEQAVKARQGFVVFVPNEPTWAPIRSHPRFRELMESAGLARWLPA